MLQKLHIWFTKTLAIQRMKKKVRHKTVPHILGFYIYIYIYIAFNGLSKGSNNKAKLPSWIGSHEWRDLALTYYLFVDEEVKPSYLCLGLLFLYQMILRRNINYFSVTTVTFTAFFFTRCYVLHNIPANALCNTVPRLCRIFCDRLEMLIPTLFKEHN